MVSYQLQARRIATKGRRQEYDRYSFLRHLLGMLFGILAWGSTAHAVDMTLYDEQGKLIRGDGVVAAIGPDLFGEKVSLYTGATEFIQKDVSLPGDFALPVEVSRRLIIESEEYGSGTGARFFGNWLLEVPHLHGTFALADGWVVPGTSRTNRCSQFGAPPDARPLGGLGWFSASEFWSGNFLYLPGSGNQELLARGVSTPVPTDGLSYPVVTRDGAVVTCPTPTSWAGEGFVVRTPDGTRYNFSHLASRRASTLTKRVGEPPLLIGEPDPDFRAPEMYWLERSVVMIFPSTVTDRFGNTVTYSWDPAVPDRLLSITASDGRSLTFTYPSAGSASVTDGTRTWNYTSSYGVPSQVQLPDGSSWTLDTTALTASARMSGDGASCDFGAISAGVSRSGSMVHPSGARGDFTFKITPHGRSWVSRECLGAGIGEPADGAGSYASHPREFPVWSLSTKRLTGVGLPTAGYTWTYTYGASNHCWSPPTGPGATNVCTSSSPTTKEVNIDDPLGIRTRLTFGNRSGVNEGQLLRTDLGWNGSTALRTTTTTYRSPSAGPYPNPVGYTAQTRGDFVLSTGLSPEQTQTIAQDGATFTRNVTLFDTRARALQTTRSSSLGYSKAEVIAYHDNTSKWVLGQIASQSEGGIAVVANTYDPTTATHLTESRFGKLERTYTYLSNGALGTSKDGRNQITTYSNYKRGIPQFFLYADGSSMSAVVNNIGLVTSVTNAVGYATTYAYDVMGRLSSIRYPTGDSTSWNDTYFDFEKITGAEYGLGNPHWRQTVRTGSGNTISYFDALWRPVLTASEDTATPGTKRLTARAFDHQGRETFGSYPVASASTVAAITSGITKSYDALGRLTSSNANSELGSLPTNIVYQSPFQKRITNPRGKVMTLSFQAFDEPTESSPVSIVAPAGQTTSIARDIFGKPKSITRSGVYAGASVSMSRSFVYDANQRLCKTIEPESAATILDYDAANNTVWAASGQALLSTTDCQRASVAASQKANHVYDTRNRLTSTSYGDGTTAGTTRSWTLDGLPLTVSSSGFTWTYGYNKRRLLVSESLATGTATYAVGHAYNGNGHESTLTYPDGYAIGLLPNALGEPRQTGLLATDVTRHPNGGVKRFVYGNGVVHTTTQTARGLPDVSEDVGILKDDYDWDANGNVSQITDRRAAPGRSRTMTYDDADRLTSTTFTNLSALITYAYDPLDNIRTSSTPTPSRNWTHEYDPVNWRLNTLRRNSDSSAAFAYLYDSRGNVTTRTSNGVSQIYAFDKANRLTSVNGTLATYKYDGNGKRVSVNASGSTRTSLYTQSGKLLYEVATGTGAGNTRYLYLGNHLVAKQHSVSGVTYLHTDGLGSPIAQSNGVGAVLSTQLYEPYGAPGDSIFVDGPGFTGHVTDNVTGLSYMQARYYDPYAGRFLSADPVAANPRSFNRYWYANNNPYKFIDPDGRATCSNQDCSKSTIDDRVSRSNPQPPPVNGTEGLPKGVSRNAESGYVTEITFQNDSASGAGTKLPMDTKTAEMVENAISEARVSSVNINSSTGGTHSPNSNHPKGRAVDINRVDGAKVSSSNSGAMRIQEAARSRRAVRENFGPSIMEKTNVAGGNPATVTNGALVNSHQDHLHLSGQQ